MAKAKHIVHFTAENEFRKNFALTRVNRGVEKAFPGVHCDIGGAYENGPELVTIERSYLSKSSLEPIRERLLREGWYDEEELQIKKKGFGAYYNLVGDKNYVHKEYSYVLLHFMQEYFIKYKGEGSIETVESKYSIDTHKDLKTFKDKVKNYALNLENTSPLSFSDQMSVDNKSLLWELRKNYLHRSAKATIGMGPANKQWTRGIY